MKPITSGMPGSPGPRAVAPIIQSFPIKQAACLLFLLLAMPSGSAEPRGPEAASMVPASAERDARLGWWRDARFGMFVHWGAYSALGGTWEGKKYGGYAEHIQRAARIPIPVYRRDVVATFNPSEFNADEWVRLAKEAGMGYLVITAKHHDGFAMYDSKASDYNIVKATPFGRDPMKELRDACKKQGIRFGFYYSHAFDWGEENAPGNDWDYANPGGDRLLHGAEWWRKFPEFLPKARMYVDEKSIPQLLELIRNYDPDIIWFDTPHKLPPEENLRILAAVRKAKPSLVVNGRLVRGCGDYASTCDRPAEFPPQSGDWEGVPTTNESYGYNENDHSHKPVSHFIRLLAKSSARGGNELMNIGPMGNGKISQPDVEILKGIGKWWAVNGESIRGTSRTPLAVQSWGESTVKGNRLFLHVFEWPKGGKLVVGGLKADVKKATLLADPQQKPLAVSRKDDDVTVSIPEDAPDPADSVVVLECASQPQGDPIRLLTGSVSAETLHVFDGKLTGGLKFGPGKKTDDHVKNWTGKEDMVVWPVRLNEPATFEVSVNYDAPAELKGPQKTEGDAGKELTGATRGDGGTYAVKIGPREFVKEVRQGKDITDTLGRVTLAPGAYEISVAARGITGEELMRLRKLKLKPLKN